jgi:hypothetical protein
MLNLVKKPMRRIPIIRVKLQNGATFEQIQDKSKFQEIILEELIIAIEDGIKKNKKSVNLFEIGDSYQLIELKRSQWKRSLNYVIKRYASKDECESYMKCAKIRDLISRV